MTRLETQAWNGQSWIIITVELTIADDSLVLLDQGVPWDGIGFVLARQVLLFLFDFVVARLQPWQVRNCESRPPAAQGRNAGIVMRGQTGSVRQTEGTMQWQDCARISEMVQFHVS